MLNLTTYKRQTGKTAALTSFAVAAVPARDSSYMVSVNVRVTTATTHSFTVVCSYTDEVGTARTATLPFVLVAGSAIVNSIINATGTVPYEGIPIHIRCQASSSIGISTTGTFTSVVYNIEAVIRPIA